MFPSLPRGQPGHIVRFADGLSGVPFSVFLALIVDASPFPTDFPSSVLRSGFPYWPLFVSFLPSPDLSLWPAWAYCPACRFTFSSLPFFPSAFLFLFCLPFLFPPPPFPRSFPLLVYFFQGVCPKWLCPKWQHPFYRPSPKWPFVAMSCASCLVPPMLRSYLGALFLCAAYAAGANYADAYCGPPAQRFLAFSSQPRAHASYHLALLSFLTQSTPLVLISPLPSF